MIEQDQIDAVSLTGSVGAGSEVGALAGKNLKKTVLELGGSDPFMVLEDADLEKAARAAVRSRTANAGQSCIAAKRLIVMESIREAFTEKFVEVMNGLRIGDPMDESTDLGPVAKSNSWKLWADSSMTLWKRAPEHTGDLSRRTRAISSSLLF